MNHPAHDVTTFAMDERPQRKRSRFAFRLGTLLLAVVVLSLPLAWVSYSLNWMRLRNAERPLNSELSPDGKLVAEYSYIPDWLSGDTSPTLILTIRDTRTGAIVNRYECLGDWPTDAEGIFRDKVPW